MIIFSTDFTVITDFEQPLTHSPWIGAALYELTGSYRAIFMAQAAFCLLPMALLLVMVPWELGRGGLSYELQHSTNNADDTGGQNPALVAGCRGELKKHVADFRAVCDGHSWGLMVVVVWGVLYQVRFYVGFMLIFY